MGRSHRVRCHRSQAINTPGNWWMCRMPTLRCFWATQILASNHYWVLHVLAPCPRPVRGWNIFAMKLYEIHPRASVSWPNLWRQSKQSTEGSCNVFLARISRQRYSYDRKLWMVIGPLSIRLSDLRRNRFTVDTSVCGYVSVQCDHSLYLSSALTK